MRIQHTVKSFAGDDTYIEGQGVQLPDVDDLVAKGEAKLLDWDLEPGNPITFFFRFETMYQKHTAFNFWGIATPLFESWSWLFLKNLLLLVIFECYKNFQKLIISCDVKV